MRLSGDGSSIRYTDEEGHYVFAGLDHGGAYTICPGKGADVVLYALAPDSLVFENLAANCDTADFIAEAPHVETPPTGGTLATGRTYAYPSPFGPGDECVIFRFSAERDGNVTIRIYDAGNHLVATPVDGMAMRAREEQYIPWDGTTQEHGAVANGVYFYVIEHSSGDRAVGKIAVLR
jgi:hypothetical protein